MPIVLIKNWIIEFKEQPIKQDDTYISGGYVEKKISYYNGCEKFIEKNWNLNPIQTEAFERIIAKIKKYNIKFLLLQAPISKEFYESYKNNEEIDNYFMEFSLYLNFNKLLSLNSTKHFYDSNHLNQIGVKVFNLSFIKYIEQKGLL